MCSQAREAALAMLRQDKNASLLKDGEIPFLLEAAFALGEKQAAACLSLRGEAEALSALLERLYRQEGIALRQGELKLPGYRVRAVYSHSPPAVTVDRQEILDLQKEIQGLCLQKGLEPWSLAREMVLAHELYHYYERQDPGLDARSLWGQNKLFGRRYLRSLSEIAAHRFSQILLQIPFYPGELDFPDEGGSNYV
ncbi:MAG: hypothetical protein AAGU12_15860 [Clostridiales bacterium]